MVEYLSDTSEPYTPLEPVEQQHSLGSSPLRKFFEAAARYEASDVLLRGGQVPKLRIRGELKAVETTALDPVEFERWIEASMSPGQWAFYAKTGSIDLGFDLEIRKGVIHRFRLNIYRTRSRSAVAARRVNNQILGLDQLNLPPILATIADGRHGLVLVCGITGCGKSTTIASMLQHINQGRSCHIVTLEDPIEYLFTDAKAVISQREIGIDVPNYNIGLRALVREDPDVVFIGELRDRETFEAALRAAETGHLVFSTMHASSTAQAFGRIYDLFPATERDGIRDMLAYHMRAFVYQKLMPTIRDEPPLVPGVELLVNGPTVRKYILEAREGELVEVIKGSRESGMQAFVDSLVELVEKQLIHPRVAQAEAPSADEVKMRLRGIRTSIT